MVIIKYVGRTTNFRGKSLWELLGNLKNFGVGRVVVRSVFERYSEPCFYKVLRVEPQPNEDIRKIQVTVEKTFRGYKNPKPINILSTSYKADYRLIPKEEEENYCKINEVPKKRIVPNKLEVPPVLLQVLKREYTKKGLPVNDDMKLDVIIRKTPNKMYRLAKDHELKDQVLPIGLGVPASPSLFGNIPSK